jgi:hypothetical protein
LESRIETKASAVVAYAVDGGADRCQQDDLTRDPLSPAASDDQLRRRCAPLVSVQFTQQLEASTHFDFSRDAVEPFIVTVADEVPSDFAIDLDLPISTVNSVGRKNCGPSSTRPLSDIDLLELTCSWG